MDISKDENKKEPRYFVNPIIRNKDPLKATYEEGCLSVPNQFAEMIDLASEVEQLIMVEKRNCKSRWFL